VSVVVCGVYSSYPQGLVYLIRCFSVPPASTLGRPGAVNHQVLEPAVQGGIRGGNQPKRVV